MARPQRPDEAALVEQDKRTLDHALKTVRRKKYKDAGDRQIAKRLEKMSGTPDLDDPRRYHGS